MQVYKANELNLSVKPPMTPNPKLKARHPEHRYEKKVPWVGFEPTTTRTMYIHVDVKLSELRYGTIFLVNELT